MRSVVRWLIPTLGLIVLDAMVRGPISDLFRQWDLFGKAIFFARRAAEVWWAQLIVGAIFGLIVGAWLDAAAARFDGRHPLTKRGKAIRLASSAERMAHRVQNALEPWLEGEPLDQVMVAAQLLERKLVRLGAGSPPTSPDRTLHQNLEAQARWLRMIAPALREGDLATARQISEGLGQAPRDGLRYR